MLIAEENFFIDKNWIPASTAAGFANLPVGHSVGTDETGAPLLEDSELIEKREETIKKEAENAVVAKRTVLFAVFQLHSEASLVENITYFRSDHVAVLRVTEFVSRITDVI